jgi:DNA-binding transcriptional LysR family regulator
MQKFTVKQLQTLSSISKFNTFYQAGATLGISGTALRNQIATLERSIGHICVKKSLKTITLTEFGRCLVLESEKIIEDYENISDWISSGNEPSGCLYITTFDRSIFPLVVYPWLSEFRKKYPGIILKFTEEKPDLEMRHMGSDIYFGISKYLGDRRQRLIQKDFTNIKLGLYASTKYIKANGIPLTIEDLAGHHFLTTSSTTPAGALYIYDENSLNNITIINKKNSTVISGSVLQFSDQDLGIFNCISTLPLLKDLIKRKKIVPVLQGYWINKVPLYTYYDIASRNEVIVKIFLDFVDSKKNIWEVYFY